MKHICSSRNELIVLWTLKKQTKILLYRNRNVSVEIPIEAVANKITKNSNCDCSNYEAQHIDILNNFLKDISPFL